MGATAFIIAEVLGVSYLDVAAAAAIPALLYYAALFVAVDLHAAKLGIRGLSRHELPDPVAIFLKGGYLFLVPITLIYLLAGPQISPLKAAVYTIGVNLLLFLGRKVAELPARRAISIGVGAALLHVGFLASAEFVPGRTMALVYMAFIALLWLATRRRVDQTSRFVSGFIGQCGRGLQQGALAALEVAAACALSGIIIGMFMLTGLGLRLSGILVDLAGGNLPLLLVLTAIASLILGMGLPTVAAYIVLSVLVAPSLINMGVEPLAAHLFIFYFGIISAITPPVALAAYAASAISGANPMRTGLTALRLGLAGFIIPFMMVYSPRLIMQGEWDEIIIATVTAFIGAASLAGGLEGYFRVRMNLFERALMCTAGLLLIFQGLATDLAGAAAIAGSFVLQSLRTRGAVTRLAKANDDPTT
jgi:TRAP transporter 4TM/12TM fusion protein